MCCGRRQTVVIYFATIVALAVGNDATAQNPLAAARTRRRPARCGRPAASAAAAATAAAAAAATAAAALSAAMLRERGGR